MFPSVKVISFISLEYKAIKEETENINSSVKVMIMSTWKSGSDLIGNIVSQHPATFYHYEPFSWHGIKRFTNEFDEEPAIILKSLLSCDHGPSLGKIKISF